MDAREPVIGIDLGTTNSVVAAVQDGTPVVIKNRAGANLTPSVVAMSKAGKLLVGQIAKRQAITNPEETVFASKRLIGRKFSSPQTQDALKHLPYRVQSGEHDDVRIRLGERQFALPEIAAMLLKELRLDAEAFFSQPVKKAVITVPAYFNDGQRQATKDAGRIAGLEVLRIINEPTAAALAYGIGRAVSGKIAVYDLGGGTFDVSVLDVGDGVFDVIATGGDTYLGGEDFDGRIVTWLIDDFEREHGANLRGDPMAVQRLRDAAEKAKIELSLSRETQVNLPFISTPAGGGGALHLQKTLTRERLESLCGDLVERTVALCEQVLGDARVRTADLKEMVLVGGMTRMPRVQEAVKRHFGREPCRGVHPDEVVALGAAVQADALTNSQSEVVLLDVTPQSLGVAVAGGYVRTLIPRNTTVPVSTTEVFTTSKDRQQTVKIMVLQGESSVAHENELLGEFVLSGLRQALRGEVSIDVTFDISSEGIVSVSARDRETGLKQSIQVTASGGLTDQELKGILESQDDALVEAQEDDAARARAGTLRAALRELSALIAEVEKLGEQTDARAAVERACEVLARGREAAESRAPRAVEEAAAAVARSAQVLRGFLARVRGGAP